MCCKRWACSHCAPRLAQRWAAKAAAAKPERFITFTVDPKLIPDPLEAHEALLNAFQTLVKVWRKRKKTFEYLAIWELQKSGMPHLHVLQRGHFIPQKWMSLFMQRAGVGTIVDISRIESEQGAAYYVTKYTQKNTAETKALLGNRRLILVSAGFLAEPITPPTDQDTAEYVWTWSSRSAWYVLDLLIRTHHYKLDDSRFPSRVLLLATDQVVDLDVIKFECDPRPLDTRDEFI
jgi:hypothetical protein